VLALVVALLVTVLNIALGLGVLLKHPKSDTHRAFAFLTVVVGLWSITNYFSLVVGNEADTLFWIRVVMAVTSFLGPAVLILVYCFPQSNAKMPKPFSVGLLGAAFGTAILSMTPALFSSVNITNGVITPQPNWGIPIYAIVFLGSLLVAFVLLIMHYRRAKGLVKTQIRYLVFGVITSFSLLAMSNFVIVVLFKNSNFVIFGPAFTLLFVGTIAFAIIQHRFLDINVLILRALSYVFTLLVLSGLAVGSLFGVAVWVFRFELSLAPLLIFTTITLIIAGLARPTERVFSKITKRLFFKSMYEPDVLLQRLGKDMTSTLDLEMMSKLVLKHLGEALQLTGSSLLVFATDDNNQKTSKPDAFQLFNVESTIQFTEADTQYLREILQNTQDAPKLDLAVLEEMDESPQKDFLRKHDVSVAVYLSLHNEVVGGLLLAPKLSGEAFSETDLELLKVFAPELAIAINNALSYQKIQHFADRLQEEVEAATHELQVANERLQELDLLKSEFVSMTSHELRTPLSAIKWFLELMQLDKKHPIQGKQAERLADIQKATSSMIELVSSLLNVSRIESGRLRVKPVPTNISDLVDGVLKTVKNQYDEKSQTFEVAVPKSIPSINLDPELVRQILLNLMTNAHKYSEKNTVVKVAIKLDGESVVCSVKDEGVGIPEAEQHRVFEKFYRSSQTMSVEGSGLGLYLTKKLVEISGGKIWFESKQGKGTTFFFSLPLAGTQEHAGEISLDSSA
jgi:signal transduction histidine kinase